MEKTILFKNTEVFFTDSGKGRGIVLLHGFLESSVIWKEITEKLSENYRVICIDLPGHGKTPCLGYVHSMELLAQLVKAVTDHLRLRRIMIAGHSMGGYAACAFADLFPQNVSGLGLIHSSASPDPDEKKRDRMRAIDAVKKDKTSFVNELVERLFFEGNHERLSEKISLIRKTGSAVSKQGLIASLEGMKDRPSRERMIAGSDFPVMYVIGRHDHVLQWEKLVIQARSAPHGDYRILENSAHMGFYEEPEAVEKALRTLARRSFRLKR